MTIPPRLRDVSRIPSRAGRDRVQKDPPLVPLNRGDQASLPPQMKKKEMAMMM